VAAQLLAMILLIPAAWSADLVVSPDGLARLGDQVFPCALGRAGVSQSKREGDGATPAGVFACRLLLYRPDRLPQDVETGLPSRALAPDDAWCDDPASPLYNLPAKLPLDASHEKLWRDDHLYDLIVVLGYNDDPPVPGLGSAIFMHLARPGLAPTAGCLAFTEPDLRAILRRLDPASRVIIQAPRP
jgi:L,D-peptidoglycan transpeptidase YkuD (ErfK/YbiS/YcfS/YnhG family)